MSLCVPVGGSVPRQGWKGGWRHRGLFARLPLGARLADAELRPEAHSSILALRDAVGCSTKPVKRRSRKDRETWGRRRSQNFLEPVGW